MTLQEAKAITHEETKNPCSFDLYKKGEMTKEEYMDRFLRYSEARVVVLSYEYFEDPEDAQSYLDTMNEFGKKLIEKATNG